MQLRASFPIMNTSGSWNQHLLYWSSATCPVQSNLTFWTVFPTGTKGALGYPGQTGRPGSPGFPGYEKGQKGDYGIKGIKGISGYIGVSGGRGISGFPGATGRRVSRFCCLTQTTKFCYLWYVSFSSLKIKMPRTSKNKLCKFTKSRLDYAVHVNYVFDSFILGGMGAPACRPNYVHEDFFQKPCSPAWHLTYMTLSRIQVMSSVSRHPAWGALFAQWGFPPLWNWLRMGSRELRGIRVEIVPSGKPQGFPWQNNCLGMKLNSFHGSLLKGGFADTANQHPLCFDFRLPWQRKAYHPVSLWCHDWQVGNPTPSQNGPLELGEVSIQPTK